jgi:hypothetical protein
MFEFGISLRGKLVIVFLVIIFIGFIFSLLKKQKISETLGLIWLTVSIGVVIMISSSSILMGFTHLIGAQYPASALTMMGLLFITSLLLYFTLKISTLTRKFKSLVQQSALKEIEWHKRIDTLQDEIKRLQHEQK